MFAKIFETIYDGSLRRDWKALVVFEQFLILSDQDGIVHKTPEAISARTAIPLDFIKHGIAILSAPDPESRSREHQGRRIVLIDPHVNWGWQIVNHAAYRSIKTMDDLRTYWRGKQQESRDARAEKAKTLQRRLNEIYSRSPKDRWSYLEETHLAEIVRRENAVAELREILSYRQRNGTYFPKSIARLLETWHSVLDRARIKEQPPDEPTL